MKYIPNPLKGNNTANNGGNNVGNNNAGNTAGGAAGGNNAGAANPPARVKYLSDISFNIGRKKSEFVADCTFSC